MSPHVPSCHDHGARSHFWNARPVQIARLMLKDMDLASIIVFVYSLFKDYYYDSNPQDQMYATQCSHIPYYQCPMAGGAHLKENVTSQTSIKWFLLAVLCVTGALQLTTIITLSFQHGLRNKRTLANIPIVSWFYGDQDDIASSYLYVILQDVPQLCLAIIWGATDISHYQCAMPPMGSPTYMCASVQTTEHGINSYATIFCIVSSATSIAIAFITHLVSIEHQLVLAVTQHPSFAERVRSIVRSHDSNSREPSVSHNSNSGYCMPEERSASMHMMPLRSIQATPYGEVQLNVNNTSFEPQRGEFQ